MSEWRLIPLSPRDPAGTMAIDEALWEAAVPAATPALTVHSFEGECLTLGFGQRSEEREEAGLGHLPWTRRLTGGGAIHHRAGGVSFGIVTAELGDAKRPGPVACAMGEFLKAVWAGLGRAGEVAACGTEATLAAPLCAERRYPGDVVAGDEKLAGREKLAGIGQRHRQGRLLVQAVLFAPVRGADVRGALASAVDEVFGASLCESSLADSVTKRAEALAAGRYRAVGWLERGRMSAVR